MSVIISKYTDSSVTDALCASADELSVLLSQHDGDSLSVQLASPALLHSAIRTAAQSDINVELLVPDSGSNAAEKYPELYRAISERTAPAPPAFAAAQMMSAASMPMAAASAPREKKAGFMGGFFGKHNEAARSSVPADEEICDEAPALFTGMAAVPKELGDALGCIDESFTEMLLRKIDERGMTDAQCYKKANIDRKLFSKIRSDIHYHPKKVTVIAFALALELDLKETEEMLKKAGFALSRSSKFDIIVEYYIENGKYDVFEINEALFVFDQCLIGA